MEESFYKVSDPEFCQNFFSLLANALLIFFFIFTFQDLPWHERSKLLIRNVFRNQ